jgi:hypothetical protein
VTFRSAPTIAGPPSHPRAADSSDDKRSLEDLSHAWAGEHNITQTACFSASGVQLPWPDKPMYSLDRLPAI